MFASLIKYFCYIAFIHLNYSLVNGIDDPFLCKFDVTDNFCKWKYSTLRTTDKWVFKSRSTTQPPEPGPLDAITQSGRFIQFTPSLTSIESEELYSEIYSETQPPNTNPICFTFYYYMFGENVGSLLLTVSHIDNFSTKKHEYYWNKTGSMADKWYRQKVTIQPQINKFMVNLQIYSNFWSGIGTIALDNIESSPGSCKTDITEPIVCNFENDDCDWKVSPSIKSDIQWFVNRGSNKTEGKPRVDHTYSTSSGHYLTTTGSFHENDNFDYVDFVSPYYNSTRCLQFWHYAQSDRVQITTKDLKGRPGADLWYTSYRQETTGWQFSYVTVFKKNPFSIVIRAKKISTKIAIDDINVRMDSCQLVSCDFNVDLCGFSSQGWKQGFGRVFNQSLIPSKLPNDRTLSYGMYIYTDFTYKPQSKREALLESEIIYSVRTSCLRFWYYKSGKNISLEVEFPGLGGDRRSVFREWSMKNSKLENWTQVEIELGSIVYSNNAYTIQFKTNNYYHDLKNDFLAIDDIQLSFISCKPKPSTTPKPTENPLASDVTCSFNVSLCEWHITINPSANGAFGLSDPYRHRYGLPKYDHFGNSKGRYIYLYNEQPNGLTIKASMYTIERNKGAQTYPSDSCLSFWFYMRTDGNAIFNFSRTRVNSTLNEMMFSKTGSFGEKWYYFETGVTETDYDHNIFLNASLESGVIAFSELEFYRRKCEEGKKNSFNDFELGEKGYKYGTGLQDYFKIFMGKNLTNQIVDHTLNSREGHFFAYDFDKGPKTDRAVLESYYISGELDSCVTLWYYIRGNQTLELLVRRYAALYYHTDGDLYYEVSGDQGPFWHGVQFDVEPDDASWTLIFFMKGYKTQKGIVALDDVNIDVGKKCSQSRRCDFENDKCLWESVSPAWAQSQVVNEIEMQKIKKLLTTQFVWNRHSGIHDGNRLWPLKDHTIKTAEGNYLILSADPPRKNGDRAVLMSQRYSLPPNTTALCLSFAYVLQSGSNIEVYQSENFFNYKQIQTQNILNVTIGDWRVTKLNIIPQNLNSTNIWIYLVGTVGANPSAFAAIDDIAVDFNKCFVDENTFDCNDDGSEKIAKNKVCDFRVHCSNGRDEMSCGSCQFSKTTCAYDIIQSNTSSFKWHAINASNGYIFAKQDKTIDPKTSAQLVSPILNYASASCRLSFEYHFGGNKALNRLAVFAKLSNQEEVQLWDSRALVIKSVKWYFSIVEAVIGRIRSPFKIIFRAYSTGNSADYIAIKNVQLLYCEPLSPALECDTSHNQSFKCLNGGCIDRSLVCDHTDDCGDSTGSDEEHCETYVQRCNFEDGFCGWNNALSNPNINSKWKLQAGTQDLLLGPTRDHSKGISSGKYLLMRNESVKYTGNYIKLYSRLDGPIFKPNPNCVMRFHYDLEGEGFVSLSVNTIHNQTSKDREVWNTDKVMNSFSFTRAEIQFSEEVTNFQVIILGSIKARVNSSSLMQPFIALDDISFTPECITFNGSSIITINSTTKIISSFTTTSGYFSTIGSNKTRNSEKNVKKSNVPLIFGIIFGVIAMIGTIGAIIYFGYFRNFLYKTPNESSTVNKLDTTKDTSFKKQNDKGLATSSF